MPNLTAQASTFRAGGYSYTGYLATVPQTVVCVASLTATPTFPAQSLAISVSSGSISDVQRGMTVRVETSGGVFKGLLRVASAGTLNSTTLPINEVAAGTVNLVSGDVVRIVREWRIWDMLVAASITFNKDSRIAYSDQGSNPPPVANAGGPVAKWITSGSTISANFSAAASYKVDPDAGTLSYAWNFGDGTPSSSTSATVSGVTFPAGFRWVSLTVSDSASGKSTIKRVPVWAFDGTTSTPTPVILEQLEGTAEHGWRASFSVPTSNASIAALPDGALVVYFEREFYGASEASYGSNVADRSNIKFVGYLVRDSITIEPDDDTVTFEAVGPLQILEQTPALPQLMVNAASPTNWQGVKSLTVSRALWYLYNWHTTFATVFDTLEVDGGTYGNPALLRLAVQDVSSAAGQLRDVATASNLQVSCDRLGRLVFVRQFDYLPSGDRSSRTKTYDLTTADIREARIERNHRGSVKFTRGEGITTAGAPVFSNAPGNAPAPFGTSSDNINRQIVSDQTELNQRTGLHFAKVNGLYNGQFVPQEATLTLPDGYDVFDPAYNEALTLTLAASTNKRGVSFGTGTRWTLERVTVRHNAENGTKDVTLTLAHETTGPNGVTYVPPAPVSFGLGDFTGFDFQFGGFDYTPPVHPLGVGTIAVFLTGNYMAITGDFSTPSSAGGPTWTATNLAALPNWDGTLQDFVVDAYSPKYLGTGTTVNGWIATSTRILRITDIFGTPTLTNRYTPVATAVGRRRLAATRGRQNHIVCSAYYRDDATYPGTWVTYTTDDSSYSEVQITAHYENQTTGRVPGVFISERINGLVYALAHTATGARNSATVGLFRSTDYGATWSASTNPTANSQYLISEHLVGPYTDTTGTILYWRDVFRNGINDRYRTYRSTGTVQTNISPIVSGNDYGLQSNMAIDDSNPNRACMPATGTLAGRKVFITNNLTAVTPTWTDVTSLIPNGTDMIGARMAGSANIYVHGVNAKIAFSGDGGASWDNKTGNLNAAWGSIMNLCGN